VAQVSVTGSPFRVPDNDHPIVIESIVASPIDGEALWTGEAFRLILKYSSSESRDVIWGFSIWTGDQWVVLPAALT